MKPSECILIANGEATTARTIWKRFVSERWANPQETINVLVWPWNRPGLRQEAAVRPMGERRESNPELDEAHVEESVLETVRFRRTRPHTGCLGCRAIREGIQAQGPSAVCRARMEELRQQRLQEAERRTQDTAGKRAAKRLKMMATWLQVSLKMQLKTP